MTVTVKVVLNEAMHFVPATPLWLRVVQRNFTVGEEVELERWEERSAKSHRHEFAWLKSAWDSFPDYLLDQFPSPEHLRKYALIRTGYCSMIQYPCQSKAEAQRWAQFLRPMDDYSIVKAEDSIVTVYTAMSQSAGVMDGKKFQESKEAILRYVAGLLRVDPVTLAAQGEPA